MKIKLPVASGISQLLGVWLARNEGLVMMHYGYGYPMPAGYEPFGIAHALLGLLFFVLVVALVIRLVHHGGHGHWRHSMMGQNTAQDILNERYAKGELTKAEYETMKKDIAKVVA